MTSENRSHISQKPIEIFCGTGGVGKTTIAASRAISLAQTGRNVLLITIDPSKRLKDILGLNDETAGSIENIPTNKFIEDQAEHTFDAILMNPEATINYIAEKTSAPHILKNHILKILTRPYGGMNEILSIVELKRHLDSNCYDTIVLDTPPGGHFLDFLNSCNKINDFFDSSFLELFRYLGETASNSNLSKNIITLIVSSGAKKLLEYFQKFTGKEFVEEFIEAVQSLHDSKDIFIDAVKLSDQLKIAEFSNWFLVTSADQNKMSQANELQQQASSFIHNDSYILINKSISDLVKADITSNNNEAVNKVITSLMKREEEIISNISSDFKNVFKFPEILSINPEEHVSQLAKKWQV